METTSVVRNRQDLAQLVHILEVAGKLQKTLTNNDK